MILLDGQTLNPRMIFQPESMSLSLVETGISTATLTVGPDAPIVSIDDWMQDDTDPGEGIVWRVKGVDTAFETQTRTIQLEHVISTLRDQILFGEIKTSTMAGSNAANVPAVTAARYVLGRQSLWVLGYFEFSKSLPYNFNNVSIFAALETICSTFDDWVWEYDLTSLPFKLHIRRHREEIGCELRSDRNLLTLRRSVDRTGMYTRFYPVGARNLHIDGDYVSRNENLYGIVCKTETDQSISSKTMLRAWAEDRLAHHCEPTVTITISALELSEATGESLDKFRLGLNCRVPLPEYSTTIVNRVTRLSWSDKIRDPQRATVTLANQETDVVSIIRQIASSGACNSSGGAKAAEEDHAWIVDTTDHVGLVAEAIIGRDGDTVDWSRVSEIIVDGEGIHQRVVKAEGDLVVQQARIEVTEDAIVAEVARAKTGEAQLSSMITQTASEIRAEVAVNKCELYSVITQTATSIRSEVASTASGIYSTIVQTASSIRSEVVSASTDIYSSVIEQTSNYISVQVGSAKTDLWSGIMVTRTNIVSQVNNAKSDLYTKIEQTASSISLTINNTKSDLWSGIMITRTSIVTQVNSAKSALSSSIEQTASSINLTINGAKSTLWSGIMVTRTSIVSQVNSAKSDLSTTIAQTENSINVTINGAKSSLWAGIMVTQTSIVTQVNGAKSDLSSTIEQTASSIRSEVVSATSDLYSSVIEQTDSSISLSVSGAKSSLWSGIMVTRTRIYTQVGNAKSDIYSSIEQTESSINLTINGTKSSLWSGIMVTRTRIYTQVNSAKSSLYSSIEQTASTIRTEVANSEADIISSITETSSRITLEVARAKTKEAELSSSIVVTQSKISLVVAETTSGYKVNSAEIVAGINAQTGSYVKIKADTINLSGYVTATSLNTVDARIDNLINGTTLASSIKCTSFSATNPILGNSHGGVVTMYGNQVRMYSVKDTDGVTRGVFGYAL